MRIGTRGSALALWQARTVAARIREAGGPECELVVIRTAGDERTGPPDPPRDPPVDTGIKGPPNIKRQFVKEIEDALLDGRVDVAVHSAKDLPAQLPEGLVIAAALEREDPRDALLLPAGQRARTLDEVRHVLGERPRLGTSSVRRAAQLRAMFPGGTFPPLRGNVDTRLRKLDAGEADALVLAAAGVTRLGLTARMSAALPVEVCVPAPGQGIVAVEVSVTLAPVLREAVRRISDADAEAALVAERAVVEALGGGCQMPLGAYATIDAQELTIRALVTSLDGMRAVRGTLSGNRGSAAALGERLGARLLADGAADLLAQ